MTTTFTALAARKRPLSTLATFPLVLEALEPRMLMTAASNSVFLDDPSTPEAVMGSVIQGAGAAGGQELNRYAILGDNLSGAEAALAEMGREKIKSFKHFSGLAVKLSASEAETLQSTLGTDVRVVLDEPFQALAGVEAAGKPGSGVAGKPAGGGGKPGGQQVPWGIAAVNATDAWSVTKGAGVAVCVTDTGLDVDHPDLAANIGAGFNYITNTSTFDDDNGHGTHVGGTVAAIDNTIGVVGVAPQATLLGAKWIDRRGQGTNTDAAEAIFGCLDLRNQLNPAMPLVVNMSWGIGGTADERKIVHDAIHDVAAQGAVFVGAVGNFGPGEATPARWPEVLMVTGVDENLNLASFSGWNSRPNDTFPTYPEYRDPDFTAPAVGVLSLWKGGGTKSLDGTSMAAAHVSGVVALGFAAGTLQPLSRDPGMFEYYGYAEIPLLTPLGRDIGLIPEQQGRGFIDALLTVQNQPAQPASVAALSLSGLSNESQTSFVSASAGNNVALGAPARTGVDNQNAAPSESAAADSATAIDQLMAELAGPVSGTQLNGLGSSLQAQLSNEFSTAELLASSPA